MWPKYTSIKPKNKYSSIYKSLYKNNFAVLFRNPWICPSNWHHLMYTCMTSLVHIQQSISVCHLFYDIVECKSWPNIYPSHPWNNHSTYIIHISYKKGLTSHHHTSSSRLKASYTGALIQLTTGIPLF